MGTKNQTPLIVIVGETASGKSNLAIIMAKRFNGEIICADSRTIYKELNIGTAKPSNKEQKEIPHHLINIIRPNQKYNVAMFKEQANKIIYDIEMRKKVPILVGGTGLYIDSIVYDYQFKRTLTDKKNLDNKSLEELQKIANKQNIKQTDVNYKNKRYLLRAIETGVVKQERNSIRNNTLIIGLKLNPDILKGRIKSRIDLMVEEGFVNELKNVTKKYGWNNEAMTGTGYKAFKQYIEDRISLKEAKELFIRGDMSLAKKQRTWFKRNKSIHWVDNSNDALNLAQQFLSK